ILLGDKLPKKLGCAMIVRDVLQWLLWLPPLRRAFDFALDAAATSLALIPPEDIARIPKDEDDPAWRGYDSPYKCWLTAVQQCRAWWPEQFTAGHLTRLLGLLRWFDGPPAGLPRDR